MRIAILGGGVGGLSLAWFIARARASQDFVEVFERDAQPGGLVRGFSYAGHQFDRHYHCVLVSDTALRGLVQALGLEHLQRFKVSKMGFYDGKRCIPFNNPLDLLRFPMLGPMDKVRLIATILYCQRFGNAHRLHNTPLEPWLIRLGGQRAFERVWAPLLASKFDGNFAGMPATYLWSRMRRMQGTREKGGAVEKLGILKGGTTSLVQALAHRLPREGVSLRTGQGVKALRTQGKCTELELENGERHTFDLVVSTLPTPLHNKIAAAGDATARHAMPDKYLGIVDVVVALRRPLTPYYTLNLLDRSLPFTGIIETTHLMDPEDHGDIHLVYLPRYTDAAGALYQLDDDAIRALFLGRLRAMFPDLKADDILESWVFREPHVEPIHLQGGAFESFPESLHTQRAGVYLMNTGRLYPALHNCQAVVSLAHRTADYVLERHA